MGSGTRLSRLMVDMHLSLDREAAFPRLRRDDYRVTSSECTRYNCIAHAAGKDDNWWWPVEGRVDGVHWPVYPPIENVEGFVQAYSMEGYVVCDSREHRAGIEKIAIYVDADGI